MDEAFEISYSGKKHLNGEKESNMEMGGYSEEWRGSKRKIILSDEAMENEM